MDRPGIAKAYLSISSPGVNFGDDQAANNLARRYNDEGARLKRAHPDRFGFFACAPWREWEGRSARRQFNYGPLKPSGDQRVSTSTLMPKAHEMDSA